MESIQVLLVDDDHKAREGLGRYLRVAAGFEVLECRDGQEALKSLRNARYDFTAILLDFVLSPAMPGDVLLADLRKLYPKIPVIVYTGRDPQGGAEAIERGAYRYMRRPIDRARMVAIIRSIAEQNATYRQMAQDMRGLFQADLSLAWRADKRDHVLRIAGWYSHDELDAEYLRSISIDLRDPAWQEFLGRGHTAYLSRTTCIPTGIVYPHWAEIQEKGWQAVIAMPLVSEHRVLGLLESYYRSESPGEHTELSRILSQMLPAFASLAAGNARMADLSDQLQALGTINQIVAGTFDDKTIIRQILSRGIDLVGAESGQLYDLDIGSGKLLLRDYIDLRDRVPKEVLEPGEGLAGQAAQGGQTLYAAYSLSEIADRPVPETSATVLSEIAVPLRREEQTVGILQVQSPSPDAFNSDDIDLLNSVAAQAATTIGRTSVLEYSAEVSRLALSGNPSDLADYIVRAAHNLTGADAILWELSAKEGELEPVVRPLKSKGDFDPDYLQSAYTPITSGMSITALALERNEPVVRRDIQDPEEAPGEPKFHNLEEAKRRNWHAFVAVPLIGRGGDPIGSLNLHGKETAKFGESDVALMQVFARQMAIAMENARLIERRDTQLRGLHRIGGATHEEDLLHSLVESLGKIFPGATCAIRLYNDEKRSFGKWVSADPNPDRWRHPPRPDGTTWHVVREKKPLYIEDMFKRQVDERPTVREEFLSLGVQAIAHLPIVGQGQIVGGILYVDLFRPYHFTENDKLSLELFASQAAVAIENTRLFTEVAEKATRLEMLHKITTAISNKTTDLDAVLLQITTSLSAIFRDAPCAIRLFDSEKGKFVRRVTAGEFEEWADYPPRPESTSWHVINTKKPLYIDDVANSSADGSPSIRHEFIEELGVKAAVHLPLLSAGDKVIGLLYLDLLEPHQFSENDRLILELFASQAAIAIENAGLYSELSQRVKQLEILSTIYERIIAVGIENIDRIFDLLYEHACGVMDLSDAQVQFAFYDADRDEVSFPLAIEQDKGELIDQVRWGRRELAFRREGEDEVVSAFQPKSRGGRFGLTEYVIHTKKAILIPTDFWEAANALRMGEQQVRVLPVFGRLDRPILSYLAVPMIVQGRVMGVVSIQSLEREQAFDESHVRLLSTVANQAAVAIENARLYGEVSDRTRALEAANRQIAESEAILVRSLIASDLVHRLNNLAGTIPIWVDLISEEILGSEPQMDQAREHLNAIRKDAEALLKAAQQLSQPPRPIAVDVASVLNSMLRQLLVQSRPNLQIQSSLPSDLWPVRAEPTSLTNAIWSVIWNGVEAVSLNEVGVLSVVAENTRGADTAKDMIVVRVKDNGPGIAFTDQGKLFTAFFSTKSAGRGYGLWRARNVIENLGGSIAFKSDPGEGSTFTIKLPAALKEAQDAISHNA